MDIAEDVVYLYNLTGTGASDRIDITFYIPIHSSQWRRCLDTYYVYKARVNSDLVSLHFCTE